VLGDSELAGTGEAEDAARGEESSAPSLSGSRSPFPPLAVIEDGCAVGDVATVALSGVPMDGVGSLLPALSTDPWARPATEPPSAAPAPTFEPISRPASESDPPAAPAPDPVPAPAVAGPSIRSGVYEELVRIESLGFCSFDGSELGVGSELRPGAEVEAGVGTEPGSDTGTESDTGAEAEPEPGAGAGAAAGGATWAASDGDEFVVPSGSEACPAPAGGIEVAARPEPARSPAAPVLAEGDPVPGIEGAVATVGGVTGPSGEDPGRGVTRTRAGVPM
jgi:hypothetical protein